VQVALGGQRQVEQRVAGERRQHVVEEADAGRHVGRPGAVQIQRGADRGFGGLPHDLGAPPGRGEVLALHGGLSRPRPPRGNRAGAAGPFTIRIETKTAAGIDRYRNKVGGRSCVRSWRSLCARPRGPRRGPVPRASVYDEAWAWCVGADGASPGAPHRGLHLADPLRRPEGQGPRLRLHQPRPSPPGHQQPGRRPRQLRAGHPPRPAGRAGLRQPRPLRQQQGDHAGALEDWNRVIHLEPRAGEAYNARGLVRADQGDLLGAIADYTAALRCSRGPRRSGQPRPSPLRDPRHQGRARRLQPHTRPAPPRTDALEGRGSPASPSATWSAPGRFRPRAASGPLTTGSDHAGREQEQLKQERTFVGRRSGALTAPGCTRPAHIPSGRILSHPTTPHDPELARHTILCVRKGPQVAMAGDGPGFARPDRRPLSGTRRLSSGWRCDRTRGGRGRVTKGTAPECRHRRTQTAIGHARQWIAQAR
jgi:hypothetical protein